MARSEIRQATVIVCFPDRESHHIRSPQLHKRKLILKQKAHVVVNCRERITFISSPLYVVYFTGLDIPHSWLDKGLQKQKRFVLLFIRRTFGCCWCCSLLKFSRVQTCLCVFRLFKCTKKMFAIKKLEDWCSTWKSDYLLQMASTYLLKLANKHHMVLSSYTYTPADYGYPIRRTVSEHHFRSSCKMVQTNIAL